MAAVGSSTYAGRRPSVVIPSVAPALDDAPAPGPSDAEADAYGRAHRAHFDESAPERALAAWDDYLRLYPRGLRARGTFNRAICLVRLRRFAQAERALRSFADGRPAITGAPKRSGSSPGCATAGRARAETSGREARPYFPEVPVDGMQAPWKLSSAWRRRLFFFGGRTSSSESSGWVTSTSSTW